MTGIGFRPEAEWQFLSKVSLIGDQGHEQNTFRLSVNPQIIWVLSG
jgi:hypothetical protein